MNIKIAKIFLIVMIPPMFSIIINTFYVRLNVRGIDNDVKY